MTSRMVLITGNRVVSSLWRKTRQGGPMLMAGNTVLRDYLA